MDLRDNRLDNVFLYAGAEGREAHLLVPTAARPTRADIDRIAARCGIAPIIPASERGHVEVVRYLLAESDV